MKLSRRRAETNKLAGAGCDYSRSTWVDILIQGIPRVRAERWKAG